MFLRCMFVVVLLCSSAHCDIVYQYYLGWGNKETYTVSGTITVAGDPVSEADAIAGIATPADISAWTFDIIDESGIASPVTISSADPGATINNTLAAADEVFALPSRLRFDLHKDGEGLIEFVSGTDTLGWAASGGATEHWSASSTGDRWRDPITENKDPNRNVLAFWQISEPHASVMLFPLAALSLLRKR